MKVEVIRAYSRWPKGHIFTEMPPNKASTLIRRGLVREIVDPRPLIERVFDRSPEDRMMRAKVKKTG